jgi:cell division inhibitor SepF
MGFMDELKKLARPYSEEDEEYEDDFDLDMKSTVRTNGSAAVAAEPAYSTGSDDNVISSASTASVGADRPGSGKVVNLHNASTAALQVVLVKPDRFDAVGDIANHLREKHAVVLNLESASKDVARRLVDFLSGCAFALDGKIKKVAVSTYIIAPYNVDLVGDLLDELETNGMYV